MTLAERLRKAYEKRDEIGAVYLALDAADLIERLARERAEVVTELEKANNEFGSLTAHWSGLWKRIADLKEESNARWLRAEKSEAEVGRLGQELNRARYGEPDFAWSLHLIKMAELEAEVARLRDGHLQIIREFGDTPNGHRAAEISRAALEPKGENRG